MEPERLPAGSPRGGSGAARGGRRAPDATAGPSAGARRPAMHGVPAILGSRTRSGRTSPSAMTRRHPDRRRTPSLRLSHGLLVEAADLGVGSFWPQTDSRPLPRRAGQQRFRSTLGSSPQARGAAPRPRGRVRERSAPRTRGGVHLPTRATVHPRTRSSGGSQAFAGSPSSRRSRPRNGRRRSGLQATRLSETRKIADLTIRQQRQRRINIRSVKFGNSLLHMRLGRRHRRLSQPARKPPLRDQKTEGWVRARHPALGP